METRPLLLRSLAVATDLDAVAAVHCAAFPKSILTKIGREAVYRYYAWLMEGPHEMYTVGAIIENKLVGFFFGGIAPLAVPGFLRQNRALLARRFLLRPGLLPIRYSATYSIAGCERLIGARTTSRLHPREPQTLL